MKTEFDRYELWSTKVRYEARKAAIENVRWKDSFVHSINLIKCAIQKVSLKRVSRSEQIALLKEANEEFVRCFRQVASPDRVLALEIFLMEEEEIWRCL